MPLHSPEGKPRTSLLQRALIANAAVLGLAYLLLLVTPVEVSAPIRLIEAAILAAGLVAMLAINVVLVRRALAPLQDLATQTEKIDLRNPDRRLEARGNYDSELVAFTEAFNTMVDRLTDERRAGSRAALTAQERERLRIARALHDEAGQTLTAVALEIERAAMNGPPAQRERMAQLAAQLYDTLDEIRRISRELRPEALDDLGLVNALIALTSRVARQGVQIERRFTRELPSMSPQLELVIYRIAQEALTNVLRHAEATRCIVALEAAGGVVDLLVADDGRGMPERINGETTGIEGMRERALLVGGALLVESRPGEGTQVRLRAPIDGGA
jgi:two-component system, NarL family, sensor histidine kinase UhpB